MKWRYPIIVLLLLVLVSSASATWWDTDWTRRKVGTITTPAAADDYEVKITVVYDGDMQEDFDDLRFILDDDATELSYWIESYVASTSAVVWIETKQDDTTLYMYYGNGGIATTSSGAATFDFFDDFPGVSYDADKWSTGAGTIAVGGGILSCTGTGSAYQGLYADTTFGTSHAIRSNTKMVTHTSGNVGFGFTNIIPSGTITHCAQAYQAYPNPYKYYNWAKNGGANSISGALTSDITSYHIYDIIRNGTISNPLYKDGGLDDTRTTEISSTAVTPAFWTYYAGSVIYSDWIAVRDYVYPEPSISFGAEQPQVVAAFSADDTTVCVPQEVTFTDESTGSPTSWDWDFGDLTAHSSDQNPVHEYTTSGTYTVTLIASTAYMDDTETKVDYITANEIPTAGFTGNVTSGFPPFAVLFDGTHTGGEPDAWDWYFPNGGDAHTEDATWTFDYWIGNTPTCYDIQLNVSNACGFDWENKTNYICAYPLNSSFSVNDTAGCLPLGISFTDLTNNGTATTWDWDFGDGSAHGNTQNPTHEYTTPGPFTITLNASNLYSYDIETLVDIITTPTMNASFSVNDTAGCPSLWVEFTDLTDGCVPDTWDWDFGDGTAHGNTQNPIHEYDHAGTFTVTLNASSTYSYDVETKTNLITASGLNTSFSVNTTNGCIPFDIAFTDLTSCGVPTDWNWSFGDGDYSNDQNPVHQYINTGVFTVILNASNAYSYDIDTWVGLITASDAPVANFVADVVGGIAPLTVHFTDLSTNSPTSWDWNWGDLTAHGNTQNPSHVYGTAGTYTVILTATNDCGFDTETKVDYITVTSAANVSIEVAAGGQGVIAANQFTSGSLIMVVLALGLVGFGALAGMNVFMRRRERDCECGCRRDDRYGR